MNRKLVIPFLALLSLTSCSNNVELTDRFFCYDTYVEIKMFEGKEDDLKALKNMFQIYDALADNYQPRELTNIYRLNHRNTEEHVGTALFKLIKTSIDVQNEGATYFNPLCGSLAKLWKNALNSSKIPSETAINIELEKMNNSSVEFRDDVYVQRVGEAEIDLGGIVKGYALDEAKSYLDNLNYKRYLINAGNSSILLGEKDTNDGLFNIRIDDLDNRYLKLKNCFVSTSSKSVQGVVIDGVTYSHIINPVTGSALNVNDAVIVVSDKGYFGDAMSTSLMMNTIDEIKELEATCNIKTIVIRNKQIVYKNEEIEVYQR